MPSLTPPSHPRSYRADIDGLRAIAVVFVLAFHAFPQWFPGGFCGVDIFFVLSGYLISGILFREIETESFSYWAFYRRRIKRIFPALAVILLACLGMGWFVLFADEFARLGREVVHGAVFLSNFLLWQQADYFDKAAVTKPLLHLWSLGIEEQFYLVWPPILVWAWRRKLNRLHVICLVGIASFIANLVYLQLGSAGSYYSPLSRFWELMLGAWLSHRGATQSGLSSRALFSPLGLGLIGVSLFVIDESRAFPGWWALLPTVGTCLVIAGGTESWCNRKFLSLPVLVFIGLISYPLYLWHWPLLSFAHILQGGEPSVTVRWTALGVSGVLAWLTYRWVEQPIRHNPRERFWVRTLCYQLTACFVLGMVVLHSHGLRFRSVVQPVTAIFESGEDGRDLGHTVPDCGVEESARSLFGLCRKDRREEPVIALVGDSKAHSLFNGLVRASGPQTRLLAMAGHGSAGVPLPVISDAPLYLPYQNSINKVVSTISENPHIKVVILTMAARGLFDLDSAESLEGLSQSTHEEIAFQGVNEVINRLAKAGKKIVLTVDNPTLPDPAACVPRRTGVEFLDEVFQTTERAACSISYDRQRKLAAKYLQLLARLEENHPDDVLVYDPTSLLCDMEKRICSYQKDGRLMYSYADHVSDYAAGLIGKELIPIIRDFAKIQGSSPSADTR